MFWKRKKEEPLPPMATKASEYSRLAQVRPPEYSVPRDDGQIQKIASVTYRGSMSFYDLNRHWDLTPIQALAFADWIYDTFAEPTGAEGAGKPPASTTGDPPGAGAPD